MAEEPQEMQTYIQLAQALYAKEPSFYTDMSAQDAMVSFGKFLDQNYNSVDSQMQNMVLLSAATFERECVTAMIKYFGETECARALEPVIRKHRHSKVHVEQNAKTVD